MANRPVFMPLERFPYYQQISVDFQYTTGFEAEKRQKNIEAIHDRFGLKFPDKKILEISAFSLQPEGEVLSSMKLLRRLPSREERLSVENIYQAGRFFTEDGPFLDLLDMTPEMAREDERLEKSGSLLGYTFDGDVVPHDPPQFFFNWLYLNALLEPENEEIAGRLMDYDAFSDIEFNPSRSINGQGRAAAMYVSLRRMGLLEKVRDIRSCYDLLTDGQPYPDLAPVPDWEAIRAAEEEAAREAEERAAEKAEAEKAAKKAAKEALKNGIILPEPEPEPVKEEKKPAPVVVPIVEENIDYPVFDIGQKIVHPKYGEGEVSAYEGKTVRITFPDAGERALASLWVADKCTVK